MEEKSACSNIILPGSHDIWNPIMIDQAIIDLSAHRLEKAKASLKQAELLLQNAGYDGSINRSYYAIFNNDPL